MESKANKEPEVVLEAEHLSIAYETRKGDVEAVRDVSFQVGKGETIGLVGESGCGKSTIAYGIVNFLGPNGRIVDGHVRFQGEELVGRSQEELKRLTFSELTLSDRDDIKKYYFLQAVIIACEGVISFSHRYAVLSKKMANKENNKERKKELKKN